MAFTTAGFFRVISVTAWIFVGNTGPRRSTFFAPHPLLGVGWGNFGLSYLAHRLPEAAEEIKDPHNFVIRFLTELGFIGATLCVGWLMRVAWEITEPKTETGNLPREISPTIRTVVTSLVLGMFLYVGANVDFSLSWVDTILLLLKPLLFMLTLLLGALAGSMRSPHAWTVDSRPTEWIFYFLVTGLGLFLLHNLIDFSWFEPGAMICFMALIGSALGMDTANFNGAEWPMDCDCFCRWSIGGLACDCSIFRAAGSAW